MKRPPAGTNSARWHTITVTPPTDILKKGQRIAEIMGKIQKLLARAGGVK